MKHKWIIGVIIIIIICAIFAYSATNMNITEVTTVNNNSSDIVLKVIGQGGWEADVADGDGVDSFYNEGNATYTLNGNSSVSVTVTKQSNDNGIIEAQLIKDGKVMSNQSTNAPYGVITVKMT